MTNSALLHAKPLGAHSAYDASEGKRAREFFSSENLA
jgi:hypothetical protein